MDPLEKNLKDMKLADGDSGVVGNPKIDASDRLALLEFGLKVEKSERQLFSAFMLYNRGSQA